MARSRHESAALAAINIGTRVTGTSCSSDVEAFEGDGAGRGSYARHAVPTKRTKTSISAAHEAP
jgi:hypothetical protein